MVTNSPPEHNVPFFDDEDDEEGCCNPGEYICTGTFELVLDPNITNRCQMLIVADGIHSAAFAKKCLLSEGQQAIGSMGKKIEEDSDDRELWGLRNRKPDPSLFYLLNDSTLLCISSPHLLPEDLYSFSSKVLASLSPKTSVVVLTSSPVTHYKSDVHLSDLNVPFTRSLVTPMFCDPVKAIQLEQPNIFDGVPAALLSACDIKGVGAAACIVYTSSLDLELGVMESFSAFLRYLNCSKQLHVNQKGGTLDARSKTGNLYV